MPVAGVIVVDPAGWFPFGVAKWWAVAVVSLLSCAAAIALPVRSPPDGKLERAAGILLAVLLAIVVASAVWAVDGVYAWIGTPIRHLGALTWLLFGAMYVVGRKVAADRATSRLLVGGVVVAGACLAAYCLVELVAGAPVEIASSSDRLRGPFGSAAYLGAACCLFGPVALGAARDPSTSRRWRVVAAPTAGLLAVALAGSGSRGALVGAAVAGVATILARPATWLRERRDRRTRLVVAGSVVVAGVAAAAVAGAYERSAGWASRVDEWQVAARAIAARPLLGAGPEGYRLVVGGHVDAGYVRRYGEAVAIDRAHSGVLDVAVASGVVAAGVYLVLVAVLAAAAVRVIRHGGPVDAGFGAAVIAYVVQQQFLFPIAELDPTFWLVAGVVVARSAWLRAPDRAPLVPSRTSTAVRTALAAVVVTVAIAGAVVGIREVAADRLAGAAVDAGDVESAIDRAARATELAPLDVRHHLVLARAHEGERSLRGVDRALDAVADARRIAPHDPAVRVERARLLALRAAITGDDTDRRAAVMAWEEVLADMPRCASCHLAAADAAFERGDAAAARRHLEIAADLGDRTAAARLSDPGSGPDR